MRLSTENWREVAEQFESPVLSASDYLVYGAVLDLEERLSGLAVELENLRDREGFNARLAALKAAREHINELPSEKPNRNGYHDSALKPAERIAQELHVAHYLLGGER
jgi:hypothetical protein